MQRRKAEDDPRGFESALRYILDNQALGLLDIPPVTSGILLLAMLKHVSLQQLTEALGLGNEDDTASWMGGGGRITMETDAILSDMLQTERGVWLELQAQHDQVVGIIAPKVAEYRRKLGLEDVEHVIIWE